MVIVPGASPPRVCGERAYHTFRDSDTVVQFPGSALRAGYKVEYHPSTYRVEVGADWLRLEELRPLLARTFGEGTPAGVLADWLEERGEQGAAAILRGESQ